MSPRLGLQVKSFFDHLWCESRLLSDLGSGRGIRLGPRPETIRYTGTVYPSLILHLLFTKLLQTPDWEASYEQLRNSCAVKI
jgi:hypothetical protein